MLKFFDLYRHRNWKKAIQHWIYLYLEQHPNRTKKEVLILLELKQSLLPQKQPNNQNEMGGLGVIESYLCKSNNERSYLQTLYQLELCKTPLERHFLLDHLEALQESSKSLTHRETEEELEEELQDFSRTVLEFLNNDSEDGETRLVSLDQEGYEKLLTLKKSFLQSLQKLCAHHSGQDYAAVLHWQLTPLTKKASSKEEAQSDPMDNCA